MHRATRSQVRRGAASLVGLVALIGLVPVAWAERPTLEGEASFGVPGGDILIHYATVGADAVPTADANQDGVSDFVAEVAEAAELGLAHFIELGFVRPLDDGMLGGDGLIDFYLTNLIGADGSIGIDSCDGERCVGYAVAENDYAGFKYPTVTEGLRSVVPHELFHLVQNAYSRSQPPSWTEGTAVWAVENLYGTANGDFERFLPSFLPRGYRPFERPVGGFGDAYPYGASLWPYFLEHRFGVDVVVDTWAACTDLDFLAAADEALASRGATVDDAWIEFTRWNVFTGGRAAGGPYPNASAWPQVQREPEIATQGTVYAEGLSARYVPITVTSRARLTVAPTKGIRVVAWVVADDGHLNDGIELEARSSDLVATLEPGSYTLVVTGLSRGTITTAVDIAIGDPSADSGGCAASRGGASARAALLLGAVVLLRRRRPAPRR